MFPELLAERLRGVAELSPEQVRALAAHYEMLMRWNKVLNLTSVRKPEEAVERHYCESVFLAAHLPPGGWSVADIGSGAGFPGLPVAVVRPDCTVTLIESHQRKAVFLRESTRGLPNVRVLAKRAEEVGHAAHIQGGAPAGGRRVLAKGAQDVTPRFDWAVSRAVRASDIAGVLARMAGRVALLAGEESPAAEGIEWGAPVRLPWGHRRFLWIGTVSRGT